MTKLLIAAFAILSITINCTSAQEFKSGSIEIDANLKNIDVSAKADFGNFKSEMISEYNVSDKEVDNLYFGVKMSPAEIFFALEIGRITGKSLDNVIRVYKANRNQGWGVIAKNLGIKPGSKEFHALKGQTKAKATKGKKGHSGKSNRKGKGNGKKKNQ